jgi:hypothetical protein
MNVKLTAQELETIVSALNYFSEEFYCEEVLERHPEWKKVEKTTQKLIEKLERVEA